jgi:hydrogenase expression/formation protein HypE
MSDKILLSHGSGGMMMHRFINDAILKKFSNPLLDKLNDQAIFNVGNYRLAFSTDSYVVDPIFFPGGNIGDLAVNGTINDLAMGGAKPLYLSAGFIIEEGLEFDDLNIIIESMAKCANEAGVQIVTGDTKVVPKGKADKIFINTAGIGIVPNGINLSGDNARIGDKIIISGTIGDHGMAVLTKREGIAIDGNIRSDSMALNKLTDKMINHTVKINCMRDPTRGGVATTLNEIAGQSNVGILIYENMLPVNESVKAACEILGFDPLYVANEGKLLAFVNPEVADGLLEVMHSTEEGKDSCIIGEVVKDYPKKVVMKTILGGSRIVNMLTGEQLPRIC